LGRRSDQIAIWRRTASSIVHLITLHDVESVVMRRIEVPLVLWLDRPHAAESARPIKFRLV